MVIITNISSPYDQPGKPQFPRHLVGSMPLTVRVWCGLQDGVSFGNYRCSLAGLDLNRQWNHPSERITPVIYALKNRIGQWNKRHQKGVVLFCDFLM